jgi:hypothetical protein
MKENIGFEYPRQLLGLGNSGTAVGTSQASLFPGDIFPILGADARL